MKKNILITGLLLSIILLSGCWNSGNNQGPTATASPSATVTTAAKPTIADYFSFSANKEYIYEGLGNEYASYTRFVDYIKGSRVQTRDNNGGTEIVRVYENKNGEFRLLFSKAECYYRQSFIDGTYNKSEVLLKEPIVKGTSWALSDKSTRTITNVNATVKTDLGTYSAVEVTKVYNKKTESGKSTEYKEYFVKGIGIVKSVTELNEDKVSSTLQNIKSDEPFKQTIAIYYPNVNNSKIYYKNKVVSFKTNDDVKKIFEDAFKTAPVKYVGKLMGTNTQINSLSVGPNPSIRHPSGAILPDYMVFADFSGNFVSGMNAGSDYESMILDCITNTLGTYYQVDRVYITIDGEAYSSGHILMSKFETFKVDTQGTVEIK